MTSPMLSTQRSVYNNNGFSATSFMQQLSRSLFCLCIVFLTLIFADTTSTTSRTSSTNNDNHNEASSNQNHIEVQHKRGSSSDSSSNSEATSTASNYNRGSHINNKDKEVLLNKAGNKDINDPLLSTKSSSSSSSSSSSDTNGSSSKNYNDDTTNNKKSATNIITDESQIKELTDDSGHHALKDNERIISSRENDRGLEKNTASSTSTLKSVGGSSSARSGETGDTATSKPSTSSIISSGSKSSSKSNTKTSNKSSTGGQSRKNTSEIISSSTSSPASSSTSSLDEVGNIDSSEEVLYTDEINGQFSINKRDVRSSEPSERTVRSWADLLRINDDELQKSAVPSMTCEFSLFEASGYISEDIDILCRQEEDTTGDSSDTTNQDPEYEDFFCSRRKCGFDRKIELCLPGAKYKYDNSSSKLRKQHDNKFPGDYWLAKRDDTSGKNNKNKYLTTYEDPTLLLQQQEQVNIHMKACAQAITTTNIQQMTNCVLYYTDIDKPFLLNTKHSLLKDGTTYEQFPGYYNLQNVAEDTSSTALTTTRLFRRRADMFYYERQNACAKILYLLVKDGQCRSVECDSSNSSSTSRSSNASKANKNAKINHQSDLKKSATPNSIGGGKKSKHSRRKNSRLKGQRRRRSSRFNNDDYSSEDLNEEYLNVHDPVLGCFECMPGLFTHLTSSPINSQSPSTLTYYQSQHNNYYGTYYGEGLSRNVGSRNNRKGRKVINRHWPFSTPYHTKKNKHHATTTSDLNGNTEHKDRSSFNTNIGANSLKFETYTTERPKRYYTCSALLASFAASSSFVTGGSGTTNFISYFDDPSFRLRLPGGITTKNTPPKFKKIFEEVDESESPTTPTDKTKEKDQSKKSKEEIPKPVPVEKKLRYYPDVFGTYSDMCRVHQRFVQCDSWKADYWSVLWKHLDVLNLYNLNLGDKNNSRLREGGGTSSLSNINDNSNSRSKLISRIRNRPTSIEIAAAENLKVAAHENNTNDYSRVCTLDPEGADNATCSSNDASKRMTKGETQVIDLDEVVEPAKNTEGEETMSYNNADRSSEEATLKLNTNTVDSTNNDNNNVDGAANFSTNNSDLNKLAGLLDYESLIAGGQLVTVLNDIYVSGVSFLRDSVNAFGAIEDDEVITCSSLTGQGHLHGGVNAETVVAGSDKAGSKSFNKDHSIAQETSNKNTAVEEGSKAGSTSATENSSSSMNKNSNKSATSGKKSSTLKASKKLSKKKDNLMEVDYATGGAKILGSSKELVGSVNQVLKSDLTTYSLSPCESPTWFVIGLTEFISLEKVGFVSLEFFASQFRHIQILGSSQYPTKRWRVIGEVELSVTETRQVFDLKSKCSKQEHGCWVQFLKIRVLSHYNLDNSVYCALTKIQVYGSTVLKELDKQLEGGNTSETDEEHDEDEEEDEGHEEDQEKLKEEQDKLVKEQEAAAKEQDNLAKEKEAAAANKLKKDSAEPVVGSILGTNKFEGENVFVLDPELYLRKSQIEVGGRFSKSLKPKSSSTGSGTISSNSNNINKQSTTSSDKNSDSTGDQSTISPSTIKSEQEKATVVTKSAQDNGVGVKTEESRSRTDDVDLKDSSATEVVGSEKKFLDKVKVDSSSILDLNNESDKVAVDSEHETTTILKANNHIETQSTSKIGGDNIITQDKLSTTTESTNNIESPVTAADESKKSSGDHKLLGKEDALPELDSTTSDSLSDTSNTKTVSDLVNADTGDKKSTIISTNEDPSYQEHTTNNNISPPSSSQENEPPSSSHHNIGEQVITDIKDTKTPTVIIPAPPTTTVNQELEKDVDIMEEEEVTTLPELDRQGLLEHAAKSDGDVLLPPSMLNDLAEQQQAEVEKQKAVEKENQKAFKITNEVAALASAAASAMNNARNSNKHTTNMVDILLSGASASGSSTPDASSKNTTSNHDSAGNSNSKAVTSSMDPAINVLRQVAATAGSGSSGTSAPSTSSTGLSSTINLN